MPDAPILSEAEVQHLAGLARIALTPEEVGHLAGELTAIVDAVAAVSRVATPDVPATSHPIPLVNVLRDDVVGDVLTPAQVLSGAPDAEDGRFKVPAILGEEQ
jgi:aspartyl-tRNA(Asn)/glutamyl-tRNA(Gln) amidotransferase subunit C